MIQPSGNLRVADQIYWKKNLFEQDEERLKRTFELAKHLRQNIILGLRLRDLDNIPENEIERFVLVTPDGIASPIKNSVDIHRELRLKALVYSDALDVEKAQNHAKELGKPILLNIITSLTREIDPEADNSKEEIISSNLVVFPDGCFYKIPDNETLDCLKSEKGAISMQDAMSFMGEGIEA